MKKIVVFFRNEFACINSWGDEKQPHPRIHYSQIEKLYEVYCDVQEIKEAMMKSERPKSESDLLRLDNSKKRYANTRSLQTIKINNVDETHFEEIRSFLKTLNKRQSNDEINLVTDTSCSSSTTSSRASSFSSSGGENDSLIKLNSSSLSHTSILSRSLTRITAPFKMLKHSMTSKNIDDKPKKKKKTEKMKSFLPKLLKKKK